MKPKKPRAICLEILNRVEGTSQPLDSLLSDAFKRYRHLTSLDRAFLTELAYGTCRWRGKLDWIIERFSKTPFEKIDKGILNALRLGLYQVLFLSRTPTSAAVNESVELAKGFRGQGGASFVNGLLRSVIRQQEALPFPDKEGDAALHLSVMISHPLWLVRRWIEAMGVEETLSACVSNNRIAPLVLRVNTLRVNRASLLEKLKREGLDPSPTSYSEDGIVLRDPPPVSELPFLREGLYIIQDEASQLVTVALDPRPDERILDACAAPGGKTTHIAQRMKNTGAVTAVDLSREKLGLIREACVRLGVTNVRVTKGDARRPLPLPDPMEFDRVLADVPCSGFGTLRRNPDLRWRKGPQDIRRLGETQRSILASVACLLKPGGVLVYSTCTVFQEENEEVVTAFLSDHPEWRLDPLEQFLPLHLRPFAKEGFFKTFPLREDMDGFFMARLLKGSSREKERSISIP